MEAKSRNIDLLYREKEMQLEPLPFGAWDAMSQKLHGEQPNNNEPSGNLPNGSKFYSLFAGAFLLLTTALYFYFHSKSTNIITSSTTTNFFPDNKKETIVTTNDNQLNNEGNSTALSKITSTENPKQLPIKTEEALSPTKQKNELSEVATKKIINTINNSSHKITQKENLKTEKVQAIKSKKLVPAFHAITSISNEKKLTENKSKTSNKEVKESVFSGSDAVKKSKSLSSEKVVSENTPLDISTKEKNNSKKEEPSIVAGKNATRKSSTTQEENLALNSVKEKISEETKTFTTKELTSKQVEEILFDSKSIFPLKIKDTKAVPSPILSALFLLQSDKISPLKNIFSENKIKQETTKKNNQFFKHFEAGIKAGYEIGASSYAMNKSIVQGYLQYNLSNRTSIVLLPAIKTGNGVSYPSSSESYYYQLTGTNINTVFDSIQNYAVVTQHYDSMVVNRIITKGNSVQTELLLLAKYKLNNHFSFTAGIGFNKGTLPFTNETTNTFSNQQQVDSFFAPAGMNPTIDTTNSFVHTAQNNGKYMPFSGATQATNPLRINYFASVEYWYKRWMIELAITQQLTNLNSLNDHNLQSSYQQPYVRLMTGWKIKK